VKEEGVEAEGHTVPVIIVVLRDVLHDDQGVVGPGLSGQQRIAEDLVLDALLDGIAGRRRCGRVGRQLAEDPVLNACRPRRRLVGFLNAGRRNW
jgi:hypothetical protein